MKSVEDVMREEIAELRDDAERISGLREIDAREFAEARAEVERLRAELTMFDSEFCCPECESFDTKEVSHPNDFGSRHCNDCGYTGEPGEDFPTVLIVRAEKARLAARVEALEGWFNWRKNWTGANGPKLPDGTPWWAAAIRGDKPPGRFVRRNAALRGEGQ